MGAIMAGREENCRDKEESLELVVLETVRDVERVKDASLCMRRMDEEQALNSREKVVDIYCVYSSGVLTRAREFLLQIDYQPHRSRPAGAVEHQSSRLLNNRVT